MTQVVLVTLAMDAEGDPCAQLAIALFGNDWPRREAQSPYVNMTFDDLWTWMKTEAIHTKLATVNLLFPSYAKAVEWKLTYETAVMRVDIRP